MKENKLIAEFMKYPEGFPHKTDQYGYHQCEEGYIIKEFVNVNSHRLDLSVNVFSISDLKFHSDWNWLIPVVKTIQDMPVILDWEESTQLYKKLSFFLRELELNELYEVVIEFINSYNKFNDNR